MGYISGFLSSSFNKAKAFEAWSVKVDKDQKGQHKPFTMVKEDNLTAEKYMAETKQFAKDYIDMIDSDKDGKISYKEFEDFNIKEFNENSNNVSKDELKPLLDTLKLIYDRLNVDNNADSKDKLDFKEIMNYFFTMDTNNNDIIADGKITSQEYIYTGLMLADKTDIGKGFSELLKISYDNIFKNYK